MMASSTSVTLGNHWGAFIESQVASGRYGSASEVIRDSLRLLEEKQSRLDALRTALLEGEESGDVDQFSLQDIHHELDAR